ncbi:hypothetical protein FIU97_00980 [Roseivivax sp. THAF40]|nr:hypothetical protein FIV09_01065 [Roseivivax sp. THAF197b]QFT45134.1 hypothetical protein FIU97_00980 [Roseivivax sp. THAF40]
MMGGFGLDTQRLALTVLALMPGLVLLAIPAPVVAEAADALGITGLMGLSALISVIAVHVSGWRMSGVPSASRTPSPAPALGGLLLPRAHRTPPADFPPLDRQRAHVLQRLNLRTRPQPKPYGAAEPDRVDDALATVIGHVVELWQVERPEELTDPQIRELYMLDRLARSAPASAGRLAQNFRNPSLAIDIRDKIAALRTRRKDFEQHRDALEATRHLFSTGTAQGGLKDAATVPDPDLWHHVITQHDPTDLAQRDAALACVLQRDCNRATIALWFFDLVMDGTLEEAARAGDTAFLDKVREVIARWNAHRYMRDEIGLTPEDALADAAMAVARRLDRVAELAGTPRWDMPVAMFEQYDGPPPRPRPAWNIPEGCITTAPRDADYLPAP